jgi:hypothetical protein
LASADIQTLPEFSGPQSFDDPGPFPTYVVGTFNILPGDTSLSISGNFGNSMNSSTAGVDLYLGNILVAQCVENAGCWTGPGPTPWTDSLTPTQIALLGTGLVNFTAVQTAEFTIRLGETTLTQSAVTPEPGTIVMLGSGLLGLIGVVRRKFSRNA